MRLRWGITVALVAVLAGTAYGQRKKLEEGDPAPDFKVADWIRGDEVAELERGTVYVVEFWATWCIPCRQAIPHLSKLQQKYGDEGVVIIGVSIDEEVEDVRNFVQRNPGLFSYRVGWDDNGMVSRQWMQRARVSGIPASFMVDREGKVQYIGHPRDDQLERILNFVIEGRYDGKLFEQARPAIAAYENARNMRNWQQAFTHLQTVIEYDSHIFAPFNLDIFEILLLEMGEEQRAYAFARKLIQNYAADPALLAALAEYITVDPGIDREKRDLEVAMEAAEAARRASVGDEPKILSVLALVQYHAGDVNSAVRNQRRAWMTAPPSRKPGYERTLRTYQRARQEQRADLSH